jgi:hypothetical protein
VSSVDESAEREAPTAGETGDDMPIDDVGTVASPAGRKRFSTQIDPAVQDRARATVRGMRQATGRTYSLAQLTEDALQRHCTELEDAYHAGKPWPQDGAPRLPPGRQ